MRRPLLSARLTCINNILFYLYIIHVSICFAWLIIETHSVERRPETDTVWCDVVRCGVVYGPTTQHQNQNTSSNDMRDTTGLTNCCLSVQWALPLPTHREDAGQRTSTQMKNSPICLQLKSRKYWTRHSKVEMARATGHAADMDICHEHQLDQMTILKSVQQ